MTHGDIDICSSKYIELLPYDCSTTANNVTPMINTAFPLTMHHLGHADPTFEKLFYAVLIQNSSSNERIGTCIVFNNY